MKKWIYSISLILLGVLSCTPDRYDILPLGFKQEQIRLLKVRTNSHILYADGISELKLEAEAYDVIERELRRMKIEEGDTLTETYTQTDTVLLAASRIPAGTIRFVREDGTEITDGIYRTTEIGSGMFKVYAQAGEVKSDLFEIEVRAPFPVREKAVFPVIFHVIESYGIATPEITTAILQSRLDRLNSIFGRKLYFSANGGNPNLEFRLAKYDQSGKLLEEEGIHRVESYESGEYLLEEMQDNAWDPSRYLNVWICCYVPGWGKREGLSLPATVLSSVGDRILSGLTVRERVDDAVSVDRSDPWNIGIVINAAYDDYTETYTWRFYQYNWEANFGTYFGLLSTNTTYQQDDYCSDTYAYSNSAMTDGSYRKKSDAGYRFDSENIMDDPSMSTTISGEQVQRIRWVLDNCPSRWAYKSDFALTGE